MEKSENLETSARQRSCGRAAATLLLALAGAIGLPIGSLYAQTFSRVVTYEYHDDKALWVLGQIKRTAVDGVEESRTDYGWAAMPWKNYQFGKLQRTMAYDSTSGVGTGQLGTLKSVTDGKGNVTTFGSWKRGIPQSIAYADGKTQSAVVNDQGWITAITDENGFATGYGYDTMGRLASIVYPSSDTVAWDTITRTFVQVNEEEYGIPAGHWRLTETTDDYLKVTYFDALWRPVIEQEEDTTDDVSTLRWTMRRYDHDGRVVFASYPRNPYVDGWADYTGAPLGAALTTPMRGTTTTYDALGRVTQTKQDSELGPLTTTTQYLTGFLTQVTNPRNQSTITGYMAYDQPTYDWPISISHPEGAYTTIVRDKYGKPLSIKRSNSTSSVAVTRSYTYNSYQELCRAVEPETGATLMGYDAAGNLAWSASGLPATTACEANGTSAPVLARKAARTYDARNRLKTLAFPDTNGNQTWLYTPDGLPQRITTVNSEGEDTAVNEYTYNKRRLLTRETLSQPNWYSMGVEYEYNGKGQLAGQTYPNDLYVDYDVNALGQPRRAGDFATNVSYYPNGSIKGFTYGNGVVFSMTQNARQLPARALNSLGVSDYQYFYDANANITRIDDGVNGLTHQRQMQYDGLDRLTSATSPHFGGNGTHQFTYDVLDNLRSWKLAGVKDYANYVYNTTNRLMSIQNSAAATVLGLDYDVQGNLSNKNGQAYQFDFGNRLREVPGKGGYHYDGHGRRILAWKEVGGMDYSMYSQAGALLYQESEDKAKSIENVYLAGSLIASYEYDWNTDVFVTRYHHTDQLGSPVAVTNATGQVTERTEWEPYGAAIGKPSYDGIGFTGHMQDGNTSLVYMQQRYQDPQIGRFLSVDPVTAYSSDNWRHFNRFAYTYNNPFNFTDPDGRQASTLRITTGGGLSPAVRYGQTQSEQAPTSGKSSGVDTNGDGRPDTGLRSSGRPTERDHVRRDRQGNAIAIPSAAPPDPDDNDDDGAGRPRLVDNPKHHRFSESPQPSNVRTLYNRSIADRSGVRWAKDNDGVIHRFSRPSNGETHWNGSTAGKDPIQARNIPNDVLKQLKAQ